MEVLHHITPYFGGISPYIALTLVPEMAIDIYIYIWLVVLTILKNMKVNGKDDIPYIYIHIFWKIKVMFETTNQILISPVLQTSSNQVRLRLTVTSGRGRSRFLDNSFDNAARQDGCDKI